jgi:DNA topoisomerase I
MRLQRSTVGGPGFHRVRRGRGYSYVDSERDRVGDPAGYERIRLSHRREPGLGDSGRVC